MNYAITDRQIRNLLTAGENKRFAITQILRETVFHRDIQVGYIYNVNVSMKKSLTVASGSGRTIMDAMIAAMGKFNLTVTLSK